MLGLFAVQIIADVRSRPKMSGEWSSTLTAERCGMMTDLGQA
jgi:hypothetical protein